MQNNTAPSDRHTPGPWFRRKEWKSDRHALEIYPKDPTVKPPFKPSAVAVVNWVRDGEAIANARLIAAAPELLELAKRWAAASFLAGYSPVENSNNPAESLLFETHKAIAKAAGGAL